MRASLPINVPDSVWTHPDMRAALAAGATNGTVGQLLKLVAQYSGASQSQLAFVLGTTQPKISKYMNDVMRVERMDMFRRIADGLGMPDEARMAFGLAPRTRGLQPPQQQTAHTQEPATATDHRSATDIPVASDTEGVAIPCRASDGRIIWVSIPRRTFLLGGVAAATAGQARVRSARPAPRLAATTAADPSPIEHLERMRLMLVESDNLLGPRHVIPTVHEHVSVIQQLRSTANGADRRALQRLQAWYGEFASWLHHDAGDFSEARVWTDRALTWSQSAGDPQMPAYIYARKSQLAGDMRDVAGALDFAEAAFDLATPRSKLKAAAAAFAAHGHALNGDRDATLRMIDEARATLADLDADPESPWAVWMNDAYLDVESARCFALLGDHDEAAGMFRRAIDDLPQGFHRDRGVYLAREALAHAGAGDVEQAAQVGKAALSVAIETESGRLINELARLDGQLAEWHRVPDVAEFRDYLTATLPQEKD
jgi:tetratricopeptide (TPR) repeat protein/transcriptional regulator with XRE-family HTH domain